MVAQFDESGIRFKYPENWRLEREETDSGWSVTVQSPETAFMMLCLREDMPESSEVADTALEALREDYPELEADECVDSLSGQPAVGHDVRFFSLDLTNTCWIRSFYSVNGTVLLLGQFNDLEAEKYEPVLRAMCMSLELEE
jgi:hypothetical protein